ncbi:hypothetical protein Dda_8917 [Drechslerella dactyloides]|uniref:Orc1-like AAA ATPase domain-containing protein n=1 Tax=Drechslerella dactyloides TaxID=74499 RepID=A0AAD6IQF1_DREDA|nr:hypothetical protein Dda_8917 [Drechslerella dactyloides]
MARLELVYSASESDEEIEVDIIAIHGLDTNPDRTFIAFEKEGDQSSRQVHWLRDDNMLPTVLRKGRLARLPSRIFTYAWDANTFHDASNSAFKARAEALLQNIHYTRHKALLLAEKARFPTWQRILDGTKGIVFLGTPFRGSEGVDAAKFRVIVANLLGHGLNSQLLLKVIDKEPGNLQELTDEFVRLASDKAEPIPITMFYETEKSDVMNAVPKLARQVVDIIKAMPGTRRLLDPLNAITDIVIVPRDSACLDGPWSKRPLTVRHALLNKFRGPEDPNYKTVSECIARFVDKLISRKDTQRISRARLKQFVRSFDFPGMDTRHRATSEAHKSTFLWLLDDESATISKGDSDTNSDTDSNVDSDIDSIENIIVPDSIRNLVSETAYRFRSWIRSNQTSANLFWISGKAGAGKSTLMKFLINAPRTLEILEKTHHSQVIILSHFFLLLGSPMQRTKKGMLCTLLYRLLGRMLGDDNDATIVRRVFCMSTNPSNATSYTDWTDQALEAILCKALDLVGSTRCVCICVDAIDEFDPDCGPQDVLGLLLKLQGISGVRLIVSGRPEEALKKELGFFPHISLQNLTAEDIYYFAYDRLRTSSIYINNTLFHTLAAKIVRYGQGVFLWAALVVRVLIVELRAGHPHEALHHLLEKLPTEMAQLYKSIWKRRNNDIPSHRSEAALYFQLFIDANKILNTVPGLRFHYWTWQWQSNKDAHATAARKEVTLFHLALASDEMLARALLMDNRTIGADVVLAQCKAAYVAIEARCAGILEAVHSGENHRVVPGIGGTKESNVEIIDPQCSIRFIHRSAQEFFTSTNEGRVILKYNTLKSSDRLDRIIFASLARSWSFRYVVNGYGICYPVPSSDMHQFLVAEDIVRPTQSWMELKRLLNHCRRLTTHREDDDLASRARYARSNERSYEYYAGSQTEARHSITASSQGLDLLFFLESPRLKTMNPQEQGRLLHRAMSWQTNSTTSYCDLIRCLQRHGFFRREVVKAVLNSRIPAPLSPFGAMRMSLSQNFLVNLSQDFFGHKPPHYADRTEDENWAKNVAFQFLHLTELASDKRKMYGFSFFNDNTIPPNSDYESLFSRCYPSHHDYCNASFLVFFTFTVARAYAQLRVIPRFLELEGIGRRTGSEMDLRQSGETRIHDSLLQILAIGHVPDRGRWGAKRWTAKTVPKYAEERLVKAVSGEPHSGLHIYWDDLICHRESKDIGTGYLVDYLAKLGVIERQSFRLSKSK